jgi:hypothetical protein
MFTVRLNVVSVEEESGNETVNYYAGWSYGVW